MYSGQAEAFGILAVITFLSHYISYYSNPIPATKIQCFCDSLGIITALANMQQEKLL